MVAVAFFVMITFASALVGFGIFRLVGHRSAWIVVPSALFGTILTIFVSAASYLVAGLSYPATDERNWGSLSSVQLLVDKSKKTPDLYARFGQRLNSRKWQQGRHLEQENNGDDIDADYKITVFYPDNTRSGDDATIALEVRSASAAFPSGELHALMRVSGSVSAWTTQNCSLNTAPGIAACIADGEARNFASFVWVVSSDSGGQRQIAIEFPQLWSGSEWTAIMPYGCGDGDLCGRRFDAQSPSYASGTGNVSLDLSRREIRVPIYISTTLGISSAAYGWLAVLGVVISGALGSGWLFKAVELFWARKKKPIGGDTKS